MLQIHAIISHNLKGVETMRNRNFFTITATLSIIASVLLAMAYILLHDAWQMFSLVVSVASAFISWQMVEKIDKEDADPELEKFIKMMTGC